MACYASGTFEPRLGLGLGLERSLRSGCWLARGWRRAKSSPGVLKLGPPHSEERLRNSRPRMSTWTTPGRYPRSPQLRFGVGRMRLLPWLSVSAYSAGAGQKRGEQVYWRLCRRLRALASGLAAALGPALGFLPHRRGPPLGSLTRSIRFVPVSGFVSPSTSRRLGSGVGTSAGAASEEVPRPRRPGASA